MSESEVHMWIQKAIGGDGDAFEALYRQTRDDVYRTVSFLIFNKQDVFDIVNEVYVQLWRSLKKYDSSRAFRPWLHGLTIRQVKRWRRGLWRVSHLSERKQSLEIEDYVYADESIIQNENRQELMNALWKISYKLRVVIVLRYFHDYSLEEIGSVLQIPLGTVKSRHHLALKGLRKYFATQIDTKVECPDV